MAWRRLRNGKRGVRAQADKRGRERHLYRADWLEPRILLANLHIVDAYLTDKDGDKLATVAAGQVVYIQVEFQTTALAANATYDVRTTLDGQSYTTNINWGAGTAGTSNWVFRWGTWLTDAGLSSASAQLDAGTDIAETSESDNSKGFLVNGLTFGTKFVKPLEGTMGDDWLLVNYVDVDDSSQPHDFKGGPYTYNGHNGWDMTLANFKAMDVGASVYAAAAGTVSDVHDGEFDRQTGSNNDPANYVVIDHGGGWKTTYWHFRKYSIQVQKGDVVAAGQQLGLAGSAGNSTDAHLHWGVYYNDRLVEPAVEPSLYLGWSQPYPDTKPSIIDSGITARDPGPDMKERPDSEEQLMPGQTAHFWLRMGGFESGDDLTVRWYRPGGALYTSSNWNPGLIRYGSWDATLNIPVILGTWQVAAFVNGVEQARRSFDVNVLGGPHARLLSGGKYFVDGRTTPFDYGTINVDSATVTRTFSIQNAGVTPLSVTNITAPAGFEVVGDTSFTVAAGGSQNFDVRLLADTPGHKIGFVSLATNDPSPGEATQSFRVEGTVRSLKEMIDSKLGNGVDTIYFRYIPSPLPPILPAKTHIWIDTSPANPPTYVVDLASTNNLSIETLGGDDVVTIDYVNGDPLAGTPTYDGGTGTDKLILLGSDGNNSFLLAGGHADYNASVVNHTGVNEFVITGGDGNDTINIGNPAANSQIDSAGGSITVQGGNGNDKLMLNDQDDSGADTYTFNGNTFNKTSFGGLNFSGIDVVTLNANAFNNTIQVQTIGADLFVYGGAGDDDITIGQSILSFVAGHVVVAGQGGTDTITLNDQGYLGDDTITVTPTTVGRNNFAGLTYATLEHLTLNTANVGNGVRVEDTAPGTPVLIDAKGGDDAISIVETDPTAPVTIASSGGEDTIGINTDDVGSAVVFFPDTMLLDKLNMGQGGQATLTANGSHLLRVKTLSLDPTSILDLRDNDLIVQATAATRAATLASVVGWIKSARNNIAGKWKGPGITSSIARNNPNTTLAGMLNFGLANFAGQIVDDNSILVKYTYNGDATLDGRVNADDYFRIDSGFLAKPPAPGYRDGDFNYDGKIDADDYFLIDSAFLGQAGPLSAGNQPKAALAATTATTIKPRFSRHKIRSARHR